MGNPILPYSCLLVAYIMVVGKIPIYISDKRKECPVTLVVNGKNTGQ